MGLFFFLHLHLILIFLKIENASTCFFNIKKSSVNFYVYYTRPKPVEHDYVFSIWQSVLFVNG